MHPFQNYALTLIILLLFTTCDPPTNEKGNNAIQTNEIVESTYHKDSLVGHWVVIDTYIETDMNT